MNFKRISMAILLFTLCAGRALAWEAPCIDAPYGWSYEDERRSVAINQVSEDHLTYFVADVQLADVSVWKSVYAYQLDTLTGLISGSDAVLAINGDDFGTHKYGVILRNGKLLRERDTTRHMLIVANDGKLSMVTNRRRGGYQELSDRLLSENAWQAYEFGPALVENGEALSLSRSFDVISTRQTRKEPRTAIGQISPLHYCVIVVDGRQTGYSDGISLQDLQQLFLRYGAQTAFNLDGGGSTELWFQGEILNRPSGGHERRVSDIICF